MTDHEHIAIVNTNPGSELSEEDRSKFRLRLKTRKQDVDHCEDRLYLNQLGLEREIFAALAAGMPKAEVAQCASIAASSVNAIMKNIQLDR